MSKEAPPRPFNERSSTARVGRFTYQPATDHWTWSDGMYRIHGFEPGEVVPTLELVMSHIHPDDREAARVSRRAAATSGEPFTFPHRIVNAQQELRVVVAAGHSERHGDEICLVGHLVDITGLRRDAVESEVDAAVADFTAHRAVTEQAKGVLMQLYSVDADTAWQMLRAYSQDHNRKVRDLAVAVVDAAVRDLTPSKQTRGMVHDALDAAVRQARA